MNRFDPFDLQELQQLLIAVIAAQSIELISDTHGSLLPRLRAEIDQAIADREMEP